MTGKQKRLLQVREEDRPSIVSLETFATHERGERRLQNRKKSRKIASTNSRKTMGFRLGKKEVNEVKTEFIQSL